MRNIALILRPTRPRHLPRRARRVSSAHRAFLTGASCVLWCVTSLGNPHPVKAQGEHLLSSESVSVWVTSQRARYRSPVAVPKPQVIHPFEKPEHRWSPGHRGVDLAVPENDHAIYAPADGTVVFSGRVTNRQVLVVAHPDGRRSSFEPVQDALPAGTRVRSGEKIGTVDARAAAGERDTENLAPDEGHERPYRRCSVLCLYWGVRQGGKRGAGSGRDAEYINPLILLGAREPSILLPIPGGY